MRFKASGAVLLVLGAALLLAPAVQAQAATALHVVVTSPSAPVGSTVPLQVLATAASGGAQAGLVVTVTVSGSARVNPSQLTTDAQGQAEAAVTDSVAETVTVTASASGAIPASTQITFTGSTSTVPSTSTSTTPSTSTAPPTTAPAAVTLSGPAQLTFTDRNGLVTPPDQVLTVTGGGSNVSVTATASAPWVHTVLTGALPSLSIAVSVRPSGLTLGAHRAEIDVLSSDGSLADVVPVLLEVVKTGHSAQTVCTQAPFRDVPAGYWATSAICALAREHLIQGYPDGTFRPLQPVSREDWAIMLARAFDLPSPRTTVSFPDVSRHSYAYRYIERAAPYIPYFADGSFRPRLPVTRQDAAVSLVGALDLSAHGVDVARILSPYTDAWRISRDLRTDVAIALKDGLLHGASSTTIAPQEGLTRAQAAELLYRALRFGPSERLAGAGSTPSAGSGSTATSGGQSGSAASGTGSVSGSGAPSVTGPSSGSSVPGSSATANLPTSPQGLLPAASVFGPDLVPTTRNAPVEGCSGLTQSLKGSAQYAGCADASYVLSSHTMLKSAPVEATVDVVGFTSRSAAVKAFTGTVQSLGQDTSMQSLASPDGRAVAFVNPTYSSTSIGTLHESVYLWRVGNFHVFLFVLGVSTSAEQQAETAMAQRLGQTLPPAATGSSGSQGSSGLQSTSSSLLPPASAFAPLVQSASATQLQTCSNFTSSVSHPSTVTACATATYVRPSQASSSTPFKMTVIVGSFTTDSAAASGLADMEAGFASATGTQPTLMSSASGISVFAKSYSTSGGTVEKRAYVWQQGSKVVVLLDVSVAGTRGDDAADAIVSAVQAALAG